MTTNKIAIEALTEARNWFETQHKVISKGGPSSWDMLQCDEQKNLLDAAIAALASTVQEAEQGVPELPMLLPELTSYWECEDCAGHGVVGELQSMGHFQPPEAEMCRSCEGSGRTKIEAYITEQMTAYGQACILADRARQSAGTNDRSFCERCGKRLGTGVHTCTPPERAAIQPAGDLWQALHDMLEWYLQHENLHHTTILSNARAALTVQPAPDLRTLDQQWRLDKIRATPPAPAEKGGAVGLFDASIMAEARKIWPNASWGQNKISESTLRFARAVLALRPPGTGANNQSAAASPLMQVAPSEAKLVSALKLARKELQGYVSVEANDQGTLDAIETIDAALATPVQPAVAPECTQQYTDGYTVGHADGYASCDRRAAVVPEPFGYVLQCDWRNDVWSLFKGGTKEQADRMRQTYPKVHMVYLAPVPPTAPEQASVRDAALEEAAALCDAISRDYRDQYKGRGKHAPNNPNRANPHCDGLADGAGECEEAIRALISKESGNGN